MVVGRIGAYFSRPLEIVPWNANGKMSSHKFSPRLLRRENVLGSVRIEILEEASDCAGLKAIGLFRGLPPKPPHFELYGKCEQILVKSGGAGSDAPRGWRAGGIKSGRGAALKLAGKVCLRRTWQVFPKAAACANRAWFSLAAIWELKQLLKNKANFTRSKFKKMRE